MEIKRDSFTQGKTMHDSALEVQRPNRVNPSTEKTTRKICHIGHQIDFEESIWQLRALGLK